MSSVEPDEMTAEEYDRRLSAGEPVELDVQLRTNLQPFYTLAVTHGGAFTGRRGHEPSTDFVSPAEVLQSA